jgi:hypothetical protein
MISTGIRVTQTFLRENMRESGSPYRSFAVLGLVDRNAMTSNLEVELGMVPDTFGAHYPGGLDDTLLVMSACESGGISGRAFAAAASGEDFAMLAWSETVNASDAFTASLMLIERLALGLTSRQAHRAVADAGLAHAPSSAGTTQLEHISPGGGEVRIRELPVLLSDGQPMVDGMSLAAAITGRPGDGNPDRIRLDLRVAGVHRLNAYAVRYEIDGRPAPGRYYLGSAEPADEELAFLVTHTVDAGGDLPTGLVRLTAIVELPEGGESRYSVMVQITPLGATVTVGDETWEFQLDALIGGCITDTDEQITANAHVKGDLEEASLWVDLRPGLWHLEVSDPDSGQSWLAAAERSHMTILHEVPDGHSQVDELTIEDGRAWGTATFIDTTAFKKAWSTNGAYPNPVTGSFEVRCR